MCQGCLLVVLHGGETGTSQTHILSYNSDFLPGPLVGRETEHRSRPCRRPLSRTGIIGPVEPFRLSAQRSSPRVSRRCHNLGDLSADAGSKGLLELQGKPSSRSDSWVRSSQVTLPIAFGRSWSSRNGLNMPTFACNCGVTAR